MDQIVLRAMAKWPNVPAVRGWLALDRRGEWRIRGEPVPNRAAVEFIGRNYAADEAGRWYFQNGPQRVFADLEYTPWILVLDGAGAVRTHTGRAVARIEGAWLDDAGGMLLLTEHGVGAVCGRDLEAFADAIVDESGAVPDEERLASALAAGDASGLALEWDGARHPLGFVPAAAVPARFGFVAAPSAETEAQAPGPAGGDARG